MVQSGYEWIYPTTERIENFIFYSIENNQEIIKNFNLNQLTKRDELSLRTVLALPKASSTGLVCTTWSSRDPFFSEASDFFDEAPTVAKYAITFFVFSVFPAPDSPVINIDWFSASEEWKKIKDYQMSHIKLGKKNFSMDALYVLVNMFT